MTEQEALDRLANCAEHDGMGTDTGCGVTFDRDAARKILAQFVSETAAKAFEAGCSWMDGQSLSDDDVQVGLKVFLERA